MDFTGLQTIDDSVLRAKLTGLRRALLASRPLLVAFSGGVDSSALLALAQECLGDDMMAVTGVSPALSQHQLAQAQRVAKFVGCRHELMDTAELNNLQYADNPVDRCFFCKGELYGEMRSHYGTAWPFIADGTNTDDLGDHRPGRIAAAKWQVASPFVDAGMSKADIRQVSRILGLETAEVPASPCLASRIPYGREVTRSRLARIEAGEQAMRDLGFLDFRVRDMHDRARVEVAAPEWARAQRHRRAITAALEVVGYERCELDDRPFRSGRLNRE